MNSTVRAGLIGAGIGSASMFFLDPDRGARRRALVRDKSVWVARKSRDAAAATRRDLGNRLSGLQARAKARFSEDAVDDVKLRQRVRAALGRATSHPRAISVDAASGCIMLRGDALESEIPSIVSVIERVRGVQGVQNELRGHRSADGIPSLQGQSERPGSWTVRIRESWSPTALVTVGVAAGAVAFAAAALARNGNGREAEPEQTDDAAIGEIDIVAIDTNLPLTTFGDTEGLL